MGFLVRKNERREIRRAFPLTCQVVRERDFRLVAESALDVSPDGMFVASELDLEPGENVHVSFRATHLGIWFDTDATVARIVRGRRQSDRERGFGLRFTTMPSVKRLILRGHLRRVPPPVPRRTQRIDWAATIQGIRA